MPYKPKAGRGATVVPIRPLTRLSWWEDTHSVLEVGQFLEERGELEPLPDTWRLLLERPWAYEAEHSEFQRSLLPDPPKDAA